MSSGEQVTTAAAGMAAATPDPAMWVGAGFDYRGDRLYGDWIRAVRPIRDVLVDIRSVIDRTPGGLGQQWAVHELRDFGSWQPDEHDGLESILTVARGIGQFGLAYSGLVSVVGANSPAAWYDRFPQSYLGTWPSLRAFAEQMTAESGWHDQLARLPRHMREYVQIDFDHLTEDVQQELSVVPHDSGVWVFDPRRW